MIIQLIVVLVALSLLFLGLQRRQTHAAHAWQKIGLFLLVIAMIVAVLFRSTSDKLAHLVGVGRGADLLLYGLTLAFIIYAINSYLRQQAEKDTLFRLARKISLIEANERYKINKK